MDLYQLNPLKIPKAKLRREPNLPSVEPLDYNHDDQMINSYQIKQQHQQVKQSANGSRVGGCQEELFVVTPLPSPVPLDANSTLLAIGWINLTFYLKSWYKKTKQPILCQLKGQVNFGTLTALMGPSGAGKSTLLKCINGRERSSLSDSTEFYVSKKKALLPSFIVQDQTEHLLFNLTVRESLMYSSLLKNKSAMHSIRFNHLENIEKIVSDLMLTDCFDSSVAVCSGGEKKRLALALELTAHKKPNLICIDEPTSGLDSNAAEKTIYCLHQIARKHKLAIVTSIHTPNSDVFMLFDQIYVLAKGGKCVYMGSPNLLRQHLFECGIPCLEWQVPVEVLLKVASKSKKDVFNELGIEAIGLGPPDEIIRLMYKTYEDQKCVDENCKAQGKLLMGPLRSDQKLFNFADFYYILCRNVHVSWIRGFMVNVMGQFITLIFGLLITIYLYESDIGVDPSCIDPFVNYTVTTNGTITRARVTESKAEQNIKFLFFTILYFYFVHNVHLVRVISTDVKIFTNEHHNGWYSTSSYYYAKLLTELPILCFLCYIYCWIGYWSLSQPDMDNWYEGIGNISERFGLFMIFFTLGCINLQGLTLSISALLMNHMEYAFVVSTALVIQSCLFSGFFVNLSELGSFVESLATIGFYKLTNDSILMVVYGRKRCSFGSKVLTLFSLDDDDLWYNFWWLIGMAFVWGILGQMILMAQSNPEFLYSFLKTKLKSYSGHDNLGFKE